MGYVFLFSQFGNHGRESRCLLRIGERYDYSVYAFVIVPSEIFVQRPDQSETFRHLWRFFTIQGSVSKCSLFCFPFSRLYVCVRARKRLKTTFVQGQETIEKLVEYAVRRKCYIRWDKDPSDFPVRTLRLFLSKNNDVTSS